LASRRSTAYMCSVLHSYSAHSLLPLSFFFTDPAPTELYPLSLHDALPISCARRKSLFIVSSPFLVGVSDQAALRVLPASACASAWMRSARISSGCSIPTDSLTRSEEHTSELQSRENLVCRLLLEKKKSLKYK